MIHPRYCSKTFTNNAYPFRSTTRYEEEEFFDFDDENTRTSNVHIRFNPKDFGLRSD